MKLFNFLSRILRRNKDGRSDIRQITEKELRENSDVIESLRKYDAGEKDISTVELKQRLSRI